MINWKFWHKPKFILECQWGSFGKKLPGEQEWKSIKCAKCGHTGRVHRHKTIYHPEEYLPSRQRSYDNSCKICDCKTYYREDMYSTVTCGQCGIKYFATGDGNPDGVAFCPNGHLDSPFEPYCPGPGGAKYTPEEWDAMYGEKKE